MHIVNIPNILTSVRIAVIPFLSLLIIQEYYGVALALFLITTLTDLFDGYLARRLNQTTNFGRCFDPFADKLFFVSVLAILTFKGGVPFWFTVLIVLRDFVVAAGSLISIYKKGVSSINPHMTGKAVNLFLFLIITFSLWELSKGKTVSGALSFSLIVICSILSLFSFFIYFVNFFKKSLS